MQRMGAYYSKWKKQLGVSMAGRGSVNDHIGMAYTIAQALELIRNDLHDKKKILTYTSTLNHLSRY